MERWSRKKLEPNRGLRKRCFRRLQATRKRVPPGSCLRLISGFGRHQPVCSDGGPEPKHRATHRQQYWLRVHKCRCKPRRISISRGASFCSQQVQVVHLGRHAGRQGHSDGQLYSLLVVLKNKRQDLDRSSFPTRFFDWMLQQRFAPLGSPARLASPRFVGSPMPHPDSPQFLATVSHRHLQLLSHGACLCTVLLCG